MPEHVYHIELLYNPYVSIALLVSVGVTIIGVIKYFKRVLF